MIRMNSFRFLPAVCFCLCVGIAASSPRAHAQELASVTLPDSPGTTTYSSSASVADEPAPVAAADDPNHKDGQTKRILGIIPNFRAVSADEHPPAQSVKDKFVTATQDSFDYSSIVLPAAVAYESYLTNQTPEFGKGGVGYGRYLWHAVVDQTIENYSVEFIVPALTHEDTRYYTLGKGGFLKRAGYSLSRVVVTRNDKGKDTFNAGEVVGAGMAAGISNLYYPTPERTFANTADRWGTNVGIDAATFLFKEFWPDINHSLFHHAKS